jgi:hypothetical protein
LDCGAPGSYGRSKSRQINQLVTPAAQFGVMTIRSDPGRHVASRKGRKREDLLGIWLDLFNQFDNSTKRRAAKLRRTQRPRRPIAMRPLPRTNGSGGRAAPKGRRKLV